MAVVMRNLARTYHYVFEELSDPRIHSLPLMGSPLPVLAIVALYVYCVTSLGPQWMSDRKPFKIDRLVQAYNVLQIVLSLFIAERSMTLAWFNNYNWFCEPVDYSYEPIPLEISFICYLYFLVKILDFTDTVFFVLRKKNSQITFLHVYHHAIMVIATWIGVKYFAGGHGTFIGLLNSLIHAVMYSYYLLTSLYPDQKKNMWWKKHITQMQMVQFFLLAVQSGEVLLQPDCRYPKCMSFLFVPQGIIMFILFFNFYRKTYYPKTSPVNGKKVELKSH